jgi:hypothetical protein
MKVIIAGSRDIRDYQTVKDIAEDSSFDVSEVVSGNARGVDMLAESWAEYHDIPVELFPVTDDDWEELGAKAGPMRNEEMAEYGDALVAIWDGESSGTRSMIEKAHEQGIDVEVTLTAEPPENDLDKEELLRRLPEIDRLRDGFFKPFVIDAFLDGCPEYFWELPTSSSGRHHPVDEVGEHGNWLHTKRMYATYENNSRSLVEAGVITEREREAGKAAALLHDMFKYGFPEQEGEHTVNYHDVLGAAYVRQYTDLPDIVAELIETHNGAWHCGPEPRNIHEWAHHMADMSAAQRGTNTAIVEPADELVEMSDRLITKGKELESTNE